MRIKIIKSSGEKYWYKGHIGEVREAKFAPQRNKEMPFLYKLRGLFKIKLEDKEFSYPECGYIYKWKDIKLISIN